jgi:hypothetical protein
MSALSIPPPVLIRTRAEFKAMRLANELAAARALGDANSKTKAKKPKTVTDSRMHTATDEVQCMWNAKIWTKATPVHFVALYIVFHEKVYGVFPAEMNPATRFLAVMQAALLLKSQFNGDPLAMATFMTWVWTRETGREKWRKEHKRSGATLGWRLQFGPTLVTQWRVDHNRLKS